MGPEFEAADVKLQYDRQVGVSQVEMARKGEVGRGNSVCKTPVMVRAHQVQERRSGGRSRKGRGAWGGVRLEGQTGTLVSRAVGASKGFK